MKVWAIRLTLFLAAGGLMKWESSYQDSPGIWFVVALFLVLAACLIDERGKLW